MSRVNPAYRVGYAAYDFGILLKRFLVGHDQSVNPRQTNRRVSEREVKK